MVERLMHPSLPGAKDTASDHEYTDWRDAEALVDGFVQTVEKGKAER